MLRLDVEQDKYICVKHTHSSSFVLVKINWNLYKEIYKVVLQHFQ